MNLIHNYKIAVSFGIKSGKEVYLNTVVGGKRLVDMPSGIQLPRIC